MPRPDLFGGTISDEESVNLCKVVGCLNGALRNGIYCAAHHNNYRRRGNPLIGGRITRTGSTEILEYIEEILETETDDCIFSRLPAQVDFNGSTIRLTREICERVHVKIDANPVTVTTIVMVERGKSPLSAQIAARHTGPKGLRL